MALSGYSPTTRNAESYASRATAWRISRRRRSGLRRSVLQQHRPAVVRLRFNGLDAGGRRQIAKLEGSSPSIELGKGADPRLEDVVVHGGGVVGTEQPVDSKIGESRHALTLGVGDSLGGDRLVEPDELSGACADAAVSREVLRVVFIPRPAAPGENASTDQCGRELRKDLGKRTSRTRANVAFAASSGSPVAGCRSHRLRPDRTPVRATLRSSHKAWSTLSRFMSKA